MTCDNDFSTTSKQYLEETQIPEPTKMKTQRLKIRFRNKELTKKLSNSIKEDEFSPFHKSGEDIPYNLKQKAEDISYVNNKIIKEQLWSQ